MTPLQKMAMKLELNKKKKERERKKSNIWGSADWTEEDRLVGSIFFRARGPGMHIK